MPAGRSAAVVGVILICTVSGVCTCTLRVGVDPAAPGAGFITDTCTVPNSAWVAVPVAVSLVVETNVVGSALPANIICAFFTKLLPLAVMVNAPIGIAVGETDVRTGTGFSRSTAALPVMVASVLLTAVICNVSEVGRAVGAV